MHKPVTGALPSAVFSPPFLRYTRATPALATTPLRVDPKPDKVHWNLIDQAVNAINRAALDSLFQGTTSVLKSTNTV